MDHKVLVINLSKCLWRSSLSEWESEFERFYVPEHSDQSLHGVVLQMPTPSPCSLTVAWDLVKFSSSSLLLSCESLLLLLPHSGILATHISLNMSCREQRLADACWGLRYRRVRSLKPFPQVTEQLDQAVNSVTSHSAVYMYKFFCVFIRQESIHVSSNGNIKKERVRAFLSR